jgi:hypothetical protein
MARIYTVKQGDCLYSIAALFRVGWQKIWDDPANADLKDLRKNPNVLLPGDSVTIPDAAPPPSFKLDPDKTHKLVIKAPPPTILRLVFRTDGEPRANAAYTLTVGDDEIEGTTDGDGVLEEPVPATATEAEIVFDEGTETEISFKVALGHLDPSDSITGVQQRLNNLGFDCGPVNGLVMPQMHDAVAAFQASAGLEATGEIDDDTRAALEDAHKS